MLEPYYQDNHCTIYNSDCMEGLSQLESGSVNCCVTSPPYWGLRDYGVKGQLGLERTPAEYVEKLVAVFREVKRVLRDDGTLWLNLGDSYNAYNGGAGQGSKLSKNQTEQRPRLETGYGLQCKTLKPKDLVGIPWRVAFALQADGWYLRSDIIWHKPNPMPESVTDRPTKSHEYIFLLSKSEKYYYDADSIAEQASKESVARRGRNDYRQKEGWSEAYHGNPPKGLANKGSELYRNKRTVWTVATKPYKKAHFATFPPKLIEPCILAGCPKGGVVLDHFAGAGTTLWVAKENNRGAVGIELNSDYCQLIRDRLRQEVLELEY